MIRILTTILALLLMLPAFSLAGWGDVLDSVERVDKLITNRPAPPPAPEPAEASEEAPPQEQGRSAAPRSGDDEHFIQPDDYFISTKELGRNSWIYVDLAKMVTQPSKESKNEGEFMKVRDGQNLWTSHIWQSRIASKSELKIGMHIIAFNDNHSGDIYLEPKKKDSARGHSWFYAKITDMSDMYKGFVTVSGNYKVGLKNIRIPTPLR